jgi:uncharacterized membrane protein YjgN (DUF898 family)
MAAVTQPPPPDQPPYGGQQPPYSGGPPYGGTPPPNAYGGVPYGGAPTPDHPQAVLVLVLGILGLVLCQLISPFAWVMGTRVVREIDSSGGQVGGRSMANAGRICGIVGTCLFALGVLVLIGFVILVVVAGAGSTT